MLQQMELLDRTVSYQDNKFGRFSQSIQRDDENQNTKFILDYQEAVRQVLIRLLDIAAKWVNTQIESYFNDLYTRNHLYRTRFSQCCALEQLNSLLMNMFVYI